MNKLNVNIAFFDIDGTLTNSNKVLTLNTVNTLKKAKDMGIEIVLCSGRSNLYILNYANKLDANYIISSNGSLIYDIKKDIKISTNTIEYECVKDIFNYASENKYACILTTFEKSYINNFVDDSSIDYKDIEVELINNIDDIKKKDIYQIIIKDTNYDKMVSLEKYINTKKDVKVINYTFDYLNKVKDGYYFFDIVCNSVSKGNGIKMLLSYLNLKESNAICFGDSVNDLDMFNVCGEKVAMGNAINDIKERADYITESNDRDGISKFFDNYIF